MKNTNLALLKKVQIYTIMKNYRFGFVKEKNLDLYINEKYRSGFVKEKIQICILMKNTNLVLLKKKI